MLVRLTTAVMHRGVHLDAGTRLQIDDALAASWVSRGFAVSGIDASISPLTARVERDPIALAQLAEVGGLPVAGELADLSEAATEPAQQRQRRRR